MVCLGLLSAQRFATRATFCAMPRSGPTPLRREVAVAAVDDVVVESAVEDVIVESAPEAAVAEGAEATSDTPVKNERVLLVVSDENPYLSEGSKAALKHATATAAAGGHITAMILPPEGNATQVSVLQDTLRWWFNECGLEEEQYDELVTAEGGCSATHIADAADELESTQVVVAADTVSKKKVDMALLATFVSCPVTFVPE